LVRQLHGQGGAPPSGVDDGDRANGVASPGFGGYTHAAGFPSARNRSRLLDLIPYAAISIAAYLLGSIPTGAIVARVYRNVDITQVGSQRTGATNTARTLGPGAGAIVLLGDFAKGALAVWLAREAVGTPAALALAGFFCVVGHIWSVFLLGRGGRGVVTGLGALAIISPGMFVIACVTGSVVALISRYISLGSIAGAVATPIVGMVAYVRGDLPLELLPFVVITPALIVAMHADNIQRLRAGTERRWGRTEPPRRSPSKAT
jgi:acyl phosphate:glycerol-3-phosphate acyltransferase